LNVSDEHILGIYRIPLVDIDTAELLPIHFFVDPGPDFSWPIDGELSDDRIHLYTHYGCSRTEILETYLNLSKDTCSFEQVHPSVSSNTTWKSIDDESTSTIQTESVIAINDEQTNATSSLQQKKSSRLSLNSFSKLIHQTFIEPFSPSKRATLKHRQTINIDSTISNEKDGKRRLSSPLLNTRTNMLTMIMTNFQPKRPKTSDSMIKNYIDACVNEYHQEKVHHTSADDCSSLSTISKPLYQRSYWNNDTTSYQPTTSNYRSYRSSTSGPTGNNERRRSQRRLMDKPISVTQATSKAQEKTYDMDDTDDVLMMSGGQLSSNIAYVQKKSNPLTQVIADPIYMMSHKNS
jgi:hypothetical protein